MSSVAVVADMQSLVGDQLARVALSVLVLVFTQTGSGLLTAGVHALTYLPSEAEEGAGGG